MINFISKYKKFILSLSLIIVISSFGIFILSLGEAKAYLGEVFVNSFKWVISEAFLMIQKIVGLCVSLMSSLCQGILNLTNPHDSPAVQNGWETTRDFVNLFFVLILLVIALSTILRIEQYGIKKLLPRLIIAALLINFSLVFAGVILDFAGVLTDFFLSDKQKFFTDIASQMRLPSTMQTNAEQSTPYYCAVENSSVGGDYSNECDSRPFATPGECQNFVDTNLYGFGNCITINPDNHQVDWDKIKGLDFWTLIGSLILSTIFSLIALIVFGAFAFLLLIRLVIIYFLLILSPIAWLCMVLPSTRHIFTQWWSTFIKWVFFAPAAIFFIWLSVNTWIGGGEISGGMKETMTDEVLSSQLLPEVMTPINLVQFLIACGMMIGSLIVAQKMSIYGATGAVNTVKKIGEKAGSASWATTRAGTSAAGRLPLVNKIPKADRIKGKVMSTIEKTPVVGKAFGGPGTHHAKQAKKLEEEIKKISSFTDEDLKLIKKKGAFTKEGRLRKSAATAELANRSKTEGTYDQNKDDLKMLEQSGGNIKKVIDARPDFAPAMNKTVREVVSKIKAADMGKIQKEALTPEVIQALRDEMTQVGGKIGSNHLSEVAKLNPEVAIEIQNRVIAPNRNALRDDIRNYLNSDAGKAIYNP